MIFSEEIIVTKESCHTAAHAKSCVAITFHTAHPLYCTYQIGEIKIVV